MQSSVHVLAWGLAFMLMGLLAAQSQEARTDESFLEGFADNNTAIQQLAQGKPINGTLQFLHGLIVPFKVPKRESEGLGFPDVLLSLDIVNEGGDADLFCVPLDVDNPPAQPPTHLNFQWASNHSLGTDYVFISSNHSRYGDGAKAEFSKEAGIKQTVAFLCTVLSFSRVPTEFELELDLDYTKRSLVAEEQAAVRSIFDKCCATSGCPMWKSRGQLLLGRDTEDDLPVFDLCHVVENVCDEDGRLLRLSMDHFELDCEFPLQEMETFSRLEKIELSYNNLTGDIGPIAGVLKNMKNLTRFRAIGNSIGGSIADRRACQLAAGGLLYINLQRNLVTGPLPPCLFDNSSTLLVIILDNNPLGGSLPPSLVESSKLQALSLIETSLTGALPASMATLKNLRHLNLRRNELSGSMPSDIGSSLFLEVLDVASNELTGPVPDSLITNPSLIYLLIFNNSLSQMPGAWNTAGSAGSGLLFLEASSNRITGQLPMAALTSNLVVLSLGDNQFEGPLPDTEDLLPRTWYINLAGNLLTGSIPQSWSKIGLLTGSAITRSADLNLLSLDLSNNVLSGDVPDFLVDLHSLPIELLSGGGINLEANNFSCVNLADNETVRHLKGIEECPPATSEVVSEEGPVEPPKQTTENSDVQGSGIASTQGTAAENLSEETAVAGLTSSGDLEESTSSGSANVAGISIGIVGAIVLIAIAAVVAVVLVRRRKRLQTREILGDDYRDGDIEAPPGKKSTSKKTNAKKHIGEDPEVQMFQGQRSVDLE